jgi:hypothetical protein
MTLENTITKLRIRLRHAKKQEQAVVERCLQETYAARRAREILEQDLGEALEANGQCWICEKPKAECKEHAAAGLAESPKKVTEITKIVVAI